MLGIVAALLVTSQVAQASVNTSVGGAMCLPLSEPASGLQRGFSVIFNTSNSGVNVICPLTRANAVSSGSLSGATIVRRFVSDGSTVLGCETARMDQFGNEIAASNFQTITGPQIGIFTWGFNATSSSEDTVAVFCVLGHNDDEVVSNQMFEN
jgi:hypothetical protein